MTSLAGKYWPYNLNVQKGGSGLDQASAVIFDVEGTKVVDVLTDAQGDIVEQDLQELLTTINGGLVQTPKTPHDLGIRKWLHVPFVTPLSIVEPRRDQYPVTDANNNFITETNKTIVDAYTGFIADYLTGRLTLNGSGIAPILTMAQLHDWSQAEALNNPQPPPLLAGITQTVDGNTFQCNLAFRVLDDTFDGQGKTLNVISALTDVTIGNVGGKIQNLSIGGDLVFVASSDMTQFLALNVSGDVDFSLPGARTWTIDASTLGSVSSTVPGIVLQLINGSSVGVNNDPGNITIEQNVPVSVTVLDDETGAPLEGRRVRLVTQASTVVIDNLLTDASGQVLTTFNYGGGPDQPIDPTKSFVRGAQRLPVYESRSLRGSITASGYDVTVGLRKD